MRFSEVHLNETSISVVVATSPSYKFTFGALVGHERGAAGG